jgi:murein L,D-transpeptidase YafK
VFKVKNFKLIALFLICFLQAQAVLADKITMITVHKDAREMHLWKGKEKYKSYKIKLALAYNNPFFKKGPKRREGDHQTPEGYYKISKKRRRTGYPKSLLISYPNKKDLENARRLDIPRNQVGGMILIHGRPYKTSAGVRKWARRLGIEDSSIESWARDYFYPFFDWTNGCIAVTDAEMDEIFRLIKKNTKINIYP